MTPYQTIARLDREIDENRAELLRRETVDEMSAASWHAAWLRHPELAEREAALFEDRGIAQLARDNPPKPAGKRRAWR